MALTYEPIATTTLSSDDNYVTFSSLSGYTDIVAVLNARSTTASSNSDNYMRLATGGGSVDTGTNYSTTRLFGNGATATSTRATSQSYIIAGTIPANTATANFFGTVIVNLQNYSNTTTNKSALIRGNGAATTSVGYVSDDVGLWRNTGAITSVQFFTNGNYKSGSVFTVYGIKAA